jgi:hypothetical protein
MLYDAVIKEKLTVCEGIIFQTIETEYIKFPAP